MRATQSAGMNMIAAVSAVPSTIIPTNLLRLRHQSTRVTAKIPRNAPRE